MAHVDRLSSLVSHLEIHAERLPDTTCSNLAVAVEHETPVRLFFFRDDSAKAAWPSVALLPLRIDVGGSANPLFQALPVCIQSDLTKDEALREIVGMIQRECGSPRCGGAFALDKLCELLVVHVLRGEIERAGAEPGVFAGLAHPKLSRALVAMHDAPGQSWRVDDLLGIAGMSRSQFMSEFQSVVGTTPIAYLKTWRMVLARSAILSGDRINQVARRFGYRNSDAFSRAFASAYGVAPTSLRKST